MSMTVLDERTELTHRRLAAPACRRAGSRERQRLIDCGSEPAFARSQRCRSGHRSYVDVFLQRGSGAPAFAAETGVGGVITRDPLDGIPGTTTESNPYHYTDNDPLNKMDPRGLSSCKDASCFTSSSVGSGGQAGGGGCVPGQQCAMGPLAQQSGTCMLGNTPASDPKWWQVCKGDQYLQDLAGREDAARRNAETAQLRPGPMSGSTTTSVPGAVPRSTSPAADALAERKIDQERRASSKSRGVGCDLRVCGWTGETCGAGGRPGR